MANFNLKAIGVVWEALQRLANIPGSSWESVSRNVQRLVDDPLYRKQVHLAMTGKLVVAETTKDEWLERELNFLTQLAELGLPAISREQLEAVYQEGDSLNHRYVHAGLTRQTLLTALLKAGVKINGDSATSADYNEIEQLPTEAGVLELDLSTLMQPTDEKQRPFMLDFDEQEAWAKELGGDGLPSTEEHLYAILRARVEMGRIPFMGGWCRCRNKHTRYSGHSGGVYWSSGGGVSVDYGDRSYRFWDYGSWSRKFRKVA